MKYIIFLFLCLSIFSCHHPDEVIQETHLHTSSNNSISATSIDTSFQSASVNNIVTPEEWQEDSILEDGTKPLPWGVSGINDQNQLKVFIKILRLWVEAGNKDSIAAHIIYPLSNKRSITSPSIFLKNYDLIFNAKVKKALQNQKLPQIYRDHNGARIGSGEIWIKNISKELTDVFKIVSINN